MTNKVIICGVDTSKLPVLSEERANELMIKIKAGDKKFRWKQVFPEERKDNTHEDYPES